MATSIDTALARGVARAAGELEALTSSESTAAAAAFRRCFLERRFECALSLQSIVLSPGRRV
jgi:hypothetical protein